MVSELFFTRLPADVSFGSVRGEPGVGGPFAQPTPGRPNLSGGAGFAPEVSFSGPGGNFTASFTLELKSRTTGFRGRSADVIRYTLDGSLPSTNSPAYTAPLVITNTTHLRARAYQAGLLPGPPRSEAYLRLSTNVLGFTSTLPVLIMDTFGKDVPVAAHANFVRLSVFEPVKGKTSLTNAPTLITRGGFRARGSSSLGMAQQSFAVQFMDEFNQDKPQPFAGLPADSEWVLYAPNGFGPGMIHNPFIHQLSRELGRYSPRTRFVEVYVVRSNDDVGAAHYHGVHVLEEKVKIGPQRVAIDHLNAEDSQPPQVTGGYLLKFDRPGPAEQGFGAGGAGMIYVEPKEQTILLPQRTPQRQYLHNYFNDFGRALCGPKWLDPPPATAHISTWTPRLIIMRWKCSAATWTSSPTAPISTNRAAGKSSGGRTGTSTARSARTTGATPTRATGTPEVSLAAPGGRGFSVIRISGSNGWTGGTTCA